MSAGSEAEKFEREVRNKLDLLAEKCGWQFERCSCAGTVDCPTCHGKGWQIVMTVAARMEEKP